MKVGPTQLPAFLGDDATYRTWVQGVHDALTAIGLTQTADTGQINPATVARPGVTNSYAGYEIWRFNDALQAAHPVFIRFDYGVANALDRPALKMQVGQGSSGAGALTGNLTGVGTAVPGTTASKAAGVLLPLYASYSADEGRFMLLVNYDSASGTFGMTYVVERSKDPSTDEPTADAVMAAVANVNASATVFYVVSPSLAAVGVSGSSPVPTIANYGRSAVGLDIVVFPVMLGWGRPFLTTLLQYESADIPTNTIATINYLGRDRDYLAPGDTRLANKPILLPFD